MANKITTTVYSGVPEILFTNEGYVGVSAVMTDVGTSADANGKKIVKAGTPVAGDLTARTTAFTKAADTEGVSNAVGILKHDVDVTDGANNATVMIAGYANLNGIDSTTAALITATVKTALKGNVTFLK